MINRGMKQVLQLLFRNKYIAFETNISLLFSQCYDLPFTPYRQIFVKVKKVETLFYYAGLWPKSTIKTLELCLAIFIFNFEHIRQINLIFLLLTLYMCFEHVSTFGTR